MNNISPYVLPGILPPVYRLGTILEKTAEVFGLSPAEIAGKNRKQPAIFARHAFCLAARFFTMETTAAIGDAIGRDHSTVIASTKAAMELIETNYNDFATKYETLKKMLK